MPRSKLKHVAATFDPVASCELVLRLQLLYRRQINFLLILLQLGAFQKFTEPHWRPLDIGMQSMRLADHFWVTTSASGAFPPGTPRWACCPSYAIDLYQWSRRRRWPSPVPWMKLSAIPARFINLCIYRHCGA